MRKTNVPEKLRKMEEEMVGRQRPAYIIARIGLIVMTAVLCPFFLFVGYMKAFAPLAELARHHA